MAKVTLDAAIAEMLQFYSIAAQRIDFYSKGSAAVEPSLPFVMCTPHRPRCRRSARNSASIPK
jgi:hypothetical protein